MRLLAIIEASSITGPARNLLLFARHARALDVEVHIVVFRRRGAPTLFIDTAREMSLPVYAIPEAGRFDRSVLPRLAGLAREVKPDLVQSHAVKSHFLVCVTNLHQMAPWIPFHHGYTWPNLRMRLYNELDRWSLRRAARVLTVCGPFRRELIRKGVAPHRIVVMHNAIEIHAPTAADTSGAAEWKARLGIGVGQRVILSVGRLSREKDHLTLLTAARLLRDAARRGTVPPWHLIVVGDGPERRRIEETIRVSGMGGMVTLVGQVPSAQPYYRISDVAVISSLSEGSPYALLEAMGARVPVVATSVGGIPEIVSHNRTALLVQARATTAMAQAVGAILADRVLGQRLANRAYELVLERHAPDSWTERLVEIYRTVLAEATVKARAASE